jgi:hypothetical protein
LDEVFRLDDFDLGKILQALSTSGATSIPILDEEFRRSLLKEAESYKYRPEAETIGSGDKIVRQQLGSFEDFSGGSQYLRLENSFQSLLDDCLAELIIYPFRTRLSFNSMVLQKYEKMSSGITPHRDGLTYINLVCIFMIGGRGRFYLCADRSGRAARELEASPGRVVLMRAPGFSGSAERPFHFVTDIQEPRYTFGLRQKII